MLQALIAPLKRAVTDAVERLVGRVVVTLLLVIAGSFALAALLIKLSEMWGAVWACLAAAGVFALIALITAGVIYASEQKQEEPEPPPQPETSSESGDFAGTLSNLVVSDPVTAMSTASAAVGLYRKLGRRTSILLITLIAAAVLWSRLSDVTPEASAAAPPPAPAE